MITRKKLDGEFNADLFFQKKKDCDTAKAKNLLIFNPKFHIIRYVSVIKSSCFNECCIYGYFLSLVTLKRFFIDKCES